ncbi:MAG: dihydrofolate reductase [Epibacterium sp.]|nr:dihydrofolate reductase [Epibacterium sp.]NQX72010.1 dihydrofolate reductase [Epibacterium sp.]
MISLVVARARNGAIGKDNDIPWHAPEDQKAFQRETLGGAIIMGRNTWDSLPFKPLKNRLNIVVSSNPDAAETVVSSVEDAIDLARAQGYARIYGIGGSGIYSAMLPMADRLLITEVDLEIAAADAFFPEFDADQWDVLARQELRSQDPACVMVEYLRRNA